MAFHQSSARLWKIVPLAVAMAALPALLLGLGLARGQIIVAGAGVLGLFFFGPALVMLAQAMVVPSYLTIDDVGVRFRFYSVELSVPWSAIADVGPGVGWPALTFHEPERVARSATFIAFPPLAWMLAVPTLAVSLMLRRPLANIYPTGPRQLLAVFRANAESFGFHYGMPSSLLEAGGPEILAALRRHRPPVSAP